MTITTTVGSSGGNFGWPANAALCAGQMHISNVKFATEPNATIVMPGQRPVIQTEDGEINMRKLALAMRRIEEILLLLVEDTEKHENYPALKQLYDQYSVINKMASEE